MRKLSTIEGIPAPLPESNIDTDVIFPARFLLLLDKVGIGKYLFNERRRDKDFVLINAPFDQAEILVTGARFGIGSSREHAAWALADFGIRCIIAPSFGDIFFANCTKNGILPICLDGDEHAATLQAGLDKTSIKIDLAKQNIFIDGKSPIGFDVNPYHKDALMKGLDEIGLILANDEDDITAFETKQKQEAPWLNLTKAQHSIFKTKQK